MTDRPDRSEVCRLLNLVSQANAAGPFVVGLDPTVILVANSGARWA
jgi:hypothetical protein